MANKQNYLWIGIAVVAVIVLAIVLILNSNNDSSNVSDQDKNCRYENVVKEREPRDKWIILRGHDEMKDTVVGSCNDCFRDLHRKITVTNPYEESHKFKVWVIFSEGEAPQEKILNIEPGESKDFEFIKGDFVYTNEFGSYSYATYIHDVEWFDDTITTYTIQEYVCDR